MQFRPFYCTQTQLNANTESIAQAGRLIICTDSHSIYFCPSNGTANLIGKGLDATTSTNGLMTAAMVSKLNGIAEQATKNTASSTTPKIAGTAAVGSETNYARGDHVHPAQTTISGNAGSATKVNNAITFNNSGSGVASGTAYDGSTARTISYNSVGAAASSHTHTIANITNLQSSLDSKLNTSLKGAPNGVASLDGSGLVPQSQLPSYVDDVLEFSSKSSFPTTGDSGKIYVAIDTNLTYRWSGTAYVEISPSLALGITSSTAFAGHLGNELYTNYGAGVTKGSTTQPIYIKDGVPTVIGYTIAKSVPSNAVFTDTHYASKNVVASSTTATNNTTSSLTNGNVYLNSVENGVVTSAHKISGTGITTVTTDTSGNIAINTSTTATQSANGLMTAADKKKLDGIAAGATANVGTITGVTTASPLSGSGTSGSVTISHANSGVTASTYGVTAATALEPAFGGTFAVPGFTVNASGHITAAGSHSVKIPVLEWETV